MKEQTDRMMEKEIKVKWKMRSRQRRKLEIKRDYKATMRVKCEAGAKRGKETDRRRQKLKKEKDIEQEKKNVKKIN